MAGMADPEKLPTGVQSGRASTSGSSKIDKPDHWMYRSPKVGPFKLAWYASPISQLIVVSFVCFLCPGMFNALSGMGGGGQIDNDTVDKANTALYATFAVVGFFAGSITNKVGIKTALSFGGTGYCLYIASFLCFSHTQNRGFNIFAGSFLGVCAGILWSAQGAIMLSYPTEETKGRYISYFWIIFNLGAVIGGLVSSTDPIVLILKILTCPSQVPLGENLHATGNSTVTDGTYIGFIVLTFCGAILAWFLVDAKDVIRPDGSKVILMKNPTWQSELTGLLVTLKQDPWIILLFPMFWSSNWFYTYQFNDVNNAYFSTRASALNSILYWICQILGAGSFGWALDMKSIGRPMKAKIAWAALFVLTMGIWGGGFVFQETYTRETVDPDGSFVPMVGSSTQTVSANNLPANAFALGLEGFWLPRPHVLVHVLRLLRRCLANLRILVIAFAHAIQNLGANGKLGLWELSPTMAANSPILQDSTSKLEATSILCH